MTTPFPFTSGQVLTAAQLNNITTLPTNDQTANYVLVAGDVGKRVIMNVASANTVTVNDSVFGAGDTIFIANKGSGTSTITAGAGVTINSADVLTVSQWQGGTLYFISASAAIWFPNQRTPGLAFISSNTFSGVSSFSLPADTFTTTYDNYRLEIQITALSGTGTVRLRTSGSDNSSSSYKYSVGFAGTYTSGTFSAASSASATSFELFMEDAASPYSWQGSMDLMSPKLSDRTVFHGSCANLTKGRLYTGIFDDTTTFDSMTFLATSITGTVRVYGYANS